MSSRRKSEVKRPRSEYIAFGMIVRPDVKAANPEAKPTELIRLIAAEWQKFKADPSAFPGVQDQIDADVATDAARHSREKAAVDTKKAAKKAANPTRKTGWLLFSAENRPVAANDPEIMALENNKQRFGAISSVVGQMWAELGEAGQAEYNARAAM